MDYNKPRWGPHSLSLAIKAPLCARCFMWNTQSHRPLRRSMAMMVTEGNDSCGSGVQHHRTSSSSSSPAQTRQQRHKVEVYNEILRRLKDSGHEEAMQPGFNDQLWAHFNRLPTRSSPCILSSLLRILAADYVNSSFTILIRVSFVSLCINLVFFIVLLEFYFIYFLWVCLREVLAVDWFCFKRELA